MIVLACVKTCTREVPTNYILLLVFTLSEGYLVSYLTAMYNDKNIVIVAAGLTLGVTIGLTIYAFFTKTDYTYLGAFLATAGCLLILGCIACFWMHFYWLYMIYCVLGLIIYSFYLVYDTQLIMGGKRYELSLDDYVIAAVIIYLDIVMIFVYLLMLIGGGSR